MLTTGTFKVSRRDAYYYRRREGGKFIESVGFALRVGSMKFRATGNIGADRQTVDLHIGVAK